MYRFDKCSYEELQIIRQTEKLHLSGWGFLTKEYIDETNKIYDEAEIMIALINYYFNDDKKDKMCIALFEVFPQYRNSGHGKKIIAQFLKNYQGEVDLLPSNEENESFWKQCGFKSGCYMDLRQ